MNLFWLILFSMSALASPLEQMQKRADIYHEIKSGEHCIEATQNLSYAAADSGLMTNINCEFTCAGGTKQTKKVAAAFVPTVFGLYPGDGSSTNNTLWRSLAPTMKMWSEEVCITHAAIICKDVNNITDSSVKSIESGEWRLDNHPGCNEKKPIFSPFDSSVKSEKIPVSVKNMLEAATKKHDLKAYEDIYAAAKVKAPKSCKKKINLSLCFGDCVYEVTKGGAWKETLATPEPLGTDKTTWCMDGFETAMSAHKTLPKHLKVKLCETFFWSNLMHSMGLGSSCAAIRGTTDCDKYVQ